jgi:hypothetical protein
MSPEIIPFKEPRALAGLAAKPAAVFPPNEKAAERFVGFFMANIRNKNTRRANYKAACRISHWCESRGPGPSQSKSIRSAPRCCFTVGIFVACPTGSRTSKIYSLSAQSPTRLPAPIGGHPMRP